LTVRTPGLAVTRPLAGHETGTGDVLQGAWGISFAVSLV
jgi:hypothetical protein